MTKSEVGEIERMSDELMDIVVDQLGPVVAGLKAGLENVDLSDSDVVNIQNTALLALSTLVAAAYAKT